MASKNKDRVYMDSCCFIDMAKMAVNEKALEQNRKDDVWYLKRLCDASLNGDIQIITSTLTIAECLHAGDGFIDDAVKDLFERYLTSGRVVLPMAAGYFVSIDARDLYWKYQILLSGADSLHVATAIKSGCLEFISTDARLARSKFQKAIASIEKIGLRVKHGSETQLLPSSYKQGSLV